MGKNVIQATDTNFQSEILQSSQLAMVDFWAEWCGPCIQLGPTIDALADEYVGKIKVCKMNVDENPNTPVQYHVRGIPTVIFFKGGQKVGELVGKQSKDAYINEINKHS